MKKIFFAAILAMSCACSKESSAPNYTSIVGSWQMATSGVITVNFDIVKSNNLFLVSNNLANDTVQFISSTDLNIAFWSPWNSTQVTHTTFTGVKVNSTNTIMIANSGNIWYGSKIYSSIPVTSPTIFTSPITITRTK